MPFAILLSLGLGVLIAASMARQFAFRGGKLVALIGAALLATAAASVAGAEPTPALASASVGAMIGTILTRRN